MMKRTKIILIWMTVCFTVFALSCKKESFVDDMDDDTNSEVVIDFTTLKQNEIAKYNLLNFMTRCETSKIKYYVDDNCLGSEYQSAIHEAIQAYNDAPITIGFIRVQDREEARFVFTCVNTNDCTEGNIEITEVGLSGSSNLTSVSFEFQLGINWDTCPCTDVTDCNYVGNVPSSVFKRTVMKRIGWAIGMTYNGLGTHIEGTPDVEYDPNSIFNTPSLEMENCEFCTALAELNDNDLLAINKLYPANQEPGSGEDPCDCPEVYPDYVEIVEVCTCICREWNRSYYFEPPYTGFVEVSRTVVPCDQAEQCNDPSDNIVCSIEVEEYCNVVTPATPDPDAECYCDCGGYTFPISCDEDCPSNEWMDCVKMQH